MASSSCDISGVSLNLKRELNEMEVCSDKNSVDTYVNERFKQHFEQKLIEYDQQHQGSQRKPWTLERILDVIKDIKKAQITMISGQRRTAMEYYWMNKYDIMTTDSEDYLIFKRLGPTAPTVRIIPREQYFDILSEVHKSCGHGGRDKILNLIKTKFYIPKKAVEMFVSLCPICETKRNVPRKGIVTKPIVSRFFNIRGQVNLIDFQLCPDGEFKWLLNYQDNTTKFQNLRPLKTKKAVEVASELMKIFLMFGAPYILQSDNGREFTANVIKELVLMWPECKIVHGMDPQNQSSVESSKKDVENMLRVWMTENKSTNWSVGCFFVQYLKNASFHEIIGKSPYKALFGRDPKAGLNGSDIPTSILSNIETEEELNNFTEMEPAEAMCTADSDNNDNKSKIGMEKVENLGPNFNCVVCHNDATSVHKCKCSNNVEHATCGTEVGEKHSDFSVLCKVELLEDITIKKNNTHKGLKRAAEEMIDSTVKKMPNLEIGKSVLVSVPKVDRGPLDMKNIQGIIVDIRNGVHRVGTKNGTIKNWFSRQDLQYSDIIYGEDISETPITLREAVASQSLFGVQGFQKCNCKPAVNQCRNNRCACFKNKIHCGSKCHGSITCVNK